MNLKETMDKKKMENCFQGKKNFPNLFSPIRIGNLRLKNRIIGAPTSPSMISTEGHFTPGMLAYLEEKARGGAAVVTYGEAIVHSASGKSHNKQLQLDAFGVRQGLSEVTRAIHNAGAYANIQLSHGGKYGGLKSVGGDVDCPETAYGPSAEMTPAGEVFEMPRELIFEIIDSYYRGAKLCKDCGFDMVQIHAAHGWLFSQFLSPVLNQRKDEFGGSLENRARFLLMVLDAVRRAVGPMFPIEIRLSGDDLTEAGLGMSDCIKVACMVEDKVDLYNISCGNHEDPDMFCRTHPSSFYPRGVNVYLAAEVKKHVNKPVACVGSLNDPTQMEEIIASGQADIVELARALLADPFLPEKALHGREEDITPCLRCYECFGETVKGESVKCSVNPTMGQQLWSSYAEYAAGRRRQEHMKRKRVLIAGAGPAGMVAAITLYDRGHEVILAEKKGEVGGSLSVAGAPFFKKDIIAYRDVLIKRLLSRQIMVHLNQEVDEKYIKETSPDVLILAIGANEMRPPIKGMELPHVMMAIEAELEPKRLGSRVAIMGGGLVGSEAAVSFAHEGRTCSVIEMKAEAAEEVNSFYRGGLMEQLLKSADIYVNTKVKEITPEGVVCEKDNETFLIEADSVVCALGFRAPYQRVDVLSDLVNESYIIGDCNNVGQIYHAVNQAYFTALRV